MRKNNDAMLSEFVLAASGLFAGHTRKEDAYRGQFGVFANIDAHVNARIDCSGVRIATQDIWKIFVHVVELQQQAPPPDDLVDGVLQVRIPIDRTEFDARSTLLDKKHYVAAIVADRVRALGDRWNFDAPALAALLLECARAPEEVGFSVPRAPLLNAQGRMGAQWSVSTTFFDATIGVDIHDPDLPQRARIDLIRLTEPGFLWIAMFVGTMRWTGVRRLLLRSKPVTDVLFGTQRVTILAEDQPGVQYRRVPVQRPGRVATDFAQSQFRFEWRLHLDDAGLLERFPPPQ